MLTRLEIDNFRCFEGFVWEPARKQLILGANGCGKSSMMDALENLRRFVAGDAKVEVLFPLRERTKWLDRPWQKFCLQATIDNVPYAYELIIGAGGDPRKPFVELERLDCGGGAESVRFERGHVTIDAGFDGGGFEPSTSYPLDSSRSAISSLGGEATDLATRFRSWMGTMLCFRLNPFAMVSRAAGEDAEPKRDLSNFAEWYRSQYQSYPKRAQSLFKDLEETLDGFDSIVLQDAAEGVRLLNVLFQRTGDKPASFKFNELSEGQRCLICMYSILHFVLVQGRTVIIDEPESFVSLREMQPWLMTASDICDDSHGQLVLMSHHPELIDQWAPPYGMRFLRDGAGPVYVKAWTGVPESSLSAAELVARGWEDD